MLITLLLALVSQAQAAGFEKYITWSGRHAGSANTAAAGVQAAESIYFNPAGLASGEGAEATLNFSPTQVQFHGPILPVPFNSTVKSEKAFLPAFGAMASYKLTPEWGIGLGAYAAGGTQAEYLNQNYSILDPDYNTLFPTHKAEIQIVEFAAGSAYELTRGLRVGAAWRLVSIKAALAAAVISGGNLIAFQLDDLSSTSNAFRAGLQYEPPGTNWGLGVSWRSQVTFTATTTATGQLESDLGGSSTTLAPGPATVTNRFPQQISIGTYYGPTTRRFLLQYDFTQYAVNREVEISGSLAGGAIPLSGIPQNWSNGHNLRVGAEFGEPKDWPIRVGYQLTSRVVSKDKARATFPAPGNGHTFVAGTGKAFRENWTLNAALEVGVLSGSVTSSETPSGAAIPGSYKTTALALHTGVTYRF